MILSPQIHASISSPATRLWMQRKLCPSHYRSNRQWANRLQTTSTEHVSWSLIFNYLWRNSWPWLLYATLRVRRSIESWRSGNGHDSYKSSQVTHFSLRERAIRNVELTKAAALRNAAKYDPLAGSARRWWPWCNPHGEQPHSTRIETNKKIDKQGWHRRPKQPFDRVANLA